MSEWRAVREDRIARVNALIQVIAAVGRRFFRHGHAVSRMYQDERGRLWYQDAYFAADHQYLHSRYALRGQWSIGGTLRCLVLALKGYVMTGEPIEAGHLGPAPAWYCGGDPWGYGDSMGVVRGTALALGIIAAREPA